MAKIKYIMEKFCEMPLCAIKDDVYFNYLTGQSIENKKTLNFIKEGLKRKSMKIKDIDLVIYQIVSLGNVQDRCPVAYNYQISGCSNYLNLDKQPLSSKNRKYLIDNLMNGKYKLEMIWSDSNE